MRFLNKSAPFAALMLSLLAAVPSLAVEPVAVIDGPESVTEGQPFLISAAKSTFDADEPVVWSVAKVAGFREKASFEPFDKGGKRDVVCFVQQADPGDYLFVASVSGEGKRKVGDKESPILKTATGFIKITVRPKVEPPNPAPQPQPDPVNPQPQPQPDPIKPRPAPGTPQAIGDAYGRELPAAAAAALRAAAASDAKDAQAIILESRKAFDAGLKRSVAPMEADMIRRFGSAASGGVDPAKIPEVKLYLNGVASGILGGGN